MPIVCFYNKSNKGIERSTNKECYDNNSFHVFEDDTVVEEKKEYKMEVKKIKCEHCKINSHKNKR